jgi:hypothetical protein
VIDAAPWPDNDRLHEAIPLVGEGWLDVDSFAVGEDRITLGGWITSLRDRPALREGEWTEVSWVIRPDDPWLRLEGADGLWINAAGDFDLLSDQLVHAQIVYGHDGSLDEDLGGAIRVSNTTGLLVERPSGASEALFPIPVSGTADGAYQVLFLEDGRLIGRLPVADNRFAGHAPAGTDTVLSEGAGRARSEPSRPGQDLDLPAGAQGWIQLTPSWELPPRPFAVTFTSEDGRSGTVVSPAEGGRLAVGGGEVALTVFGGPDVAPDRIDVQVPDGETVELGLTIKARFDAGDRVLAALGWPGDVSRTWRGTNGQALLHAWEAGARFIVTAPEDEVGRSNGVYSGLPTLLQEDGSRTVSDEGWSIVSWPWSVILIAPGHGAINPAGLNHDDLLAAVQGGPSRPRRTIVDLEWFDAATRPWESASHPSYVRLTDPGDANPADAWAAWLSWLDAGYAIPPVGPYTWVDVADASTPSKADVLAGLAAGATVATTGPLIVLRWGPATHGEVLSPDRLPDHTLQVTTAGLATPHTVAVVTEAGTLVSWLTAKEEEVFQVRLDDTPAWALAVVWDTNGSWAGTSPIWSEAPVGDTSPTAP